MTTKVYVAILYGNENRIRRWARANDVEIVGEAREILNISGLNFPNRIERWTQVFELDITGNPDIIFDTEDIHYVICRGKRIGLWRWDQTQSKFEDNHVLIINANC